MRIVLILAGIVLAGFGKPAASQEWTTFVEPSLGTRLRLPGGVFSIHEGPAFRGFGEQYKTIDGRAVLADYLQRNVQHDTPATYLRRTDRVPRAAMDYVRVTRSFFAVCFDLKYPEREKRAWDDIVTRISLSLEPLERD
jgi:hypothetical protein